jgi:hypothetical protein
MVRQGSTWERLWALFLLGLVLLLPPLLGVFDKPVLVRGIPLLYLYFFVAWGALIGLTALVMEWPADEDDAEGGESGAASDARDGGAAASADGAGRSGA